MPDLLEGVPLPDLDIEAVEAASAQIRADCGWHIAPSVTEDITLSLPWSGRFFLPSLYVTDVAAVRVDGQLVDFDWSRTGEVVVPGFRFTRGLRSVVVTVTHGYPQCPLDVRQAVASRAARLGSTARVKSEAQSAGPYSTSTTYFDVDSTSDLAPYRLPVLA